MKIVNTCHNTIHIEDVDLYIPYKDDLSAQDISPDILKKSKCIRNFILNGMLDIHSFDENEQIEKSIVYLKNKLKTSVPKTSSPKIEEDQIEEEGSAPDIQSISDNIEIKIRGLFLDASGYGKVNRNLAINLKAAGYKVKIDPVKSQNHLDESELKQISSMQNTKLSKNHIFIDSVIPTFAQPCTGFYKILYSTIESYSVPDQFLECCKTNYDEVWLTSAFSCDILKKELPDKPIYWIPTGVDHNLYSEHGDKFNFKPNIKDFVFVSVFGWNYRKGYDVLLNAYLDEFSAEDNVSLLLVSRYQGNTHKASKDKIKNDIDEIMQNFPNKDLPHIVRYNNIIKENDMPKLYRAANSFVLFSRGEGGGLPPLEASLCGLPVIMTNVSGQQMYLRNDNSYLLEMDYLSDKQGEFKIHYWDGQKFPYLKTKEVHNQAKRLLREVYDNYSEAKSKNKKLQKFILSDFTWNSTVKAASCRLQEICKTRRK